MIEFKHLRTLRALRETGNLTQAADALHLTQSALSHQLRDLELYFGVSLFVRKSRPIRFTAAGEAVLASAEKVVPEIRRLEQTLLQMGQGRRGRLHMAIECHSCYLWLIPAVNQYRSEWPEVELDFSGHWHFDALPALQQGQLDLVVTSDPLPMDNVHYVPLFRFEMLLALAHQHPLTARRWIEPEDLSDQTLIVYPVEEERLDIFRHFLRPANVAPAEVRTTEMTMMMAQLVASQRGVAALPSWAVHEYRENGLLSTRPLGEGGLWSDLYAAVREESREAAYLQSFLETVQTVSFETLQGIRRLDS